MSSKTLVTLRGEASYDASKYSFEVVEGGALQITDVEGRKDLIGPGFWIAVVERGSRDRLTWDFLAPADPRD